MKILQILFMSTCICFSVSGCTYAGTGNTTNEAVINGTAGSGAAGETKDRLSKIQIHQTEASQTGPDTYINSSGTTLQERISVPSGYRRTEAETDAFTEFLRTYPMKPDKSPVLLYDGTEKRNQQAHAAVFAMHIEPEDFQQCADSVMRIYAEYHYAKQDYSRIRYHLVSGFLFDFDTWRQGNKLKISGNSVNWIQSAANDSSKESLESYLHILFAYASTLSMSEESTPADIRDIRAGDIFIKGGSPGHVVMVADICENESGEKAFLLAQGYMPAQEFHILKNPAHEGNPWYYVSETVYPFETPEYVFAEGSYKRPPYLTQ